MSYEDEIKKLAKKVNDSLYRLEKAGLQTESQEYNVIQHYAISKNDKMYNVNTEKGTIRVTRDLSRFKTRDELYRYKSILENILNAKTRTVSGTRKAIKKGYETFQNSLTKSTVPNLTYEEYKNVFKIYRNNVEPDKRDYLGSDVVVDLIENTDIYTLTDEQIADALRYASENSVEQLINDKFYKSSTGWEYIDMDVFI